VARRALEGGGSAMDAVEAGIKQAELSEEG
jgi:hypothetical protein